MRGRPRPAVRGSPPASKVKPPRQNPAIPRVKSAPAGHRLGRGPPQGGGGATLGDALAGAFTAAPALKGYVLDEQGCVRRHVAVFVNARMIADRARLDVPLAPDDKVMVIQALTGG